MKYRKLRIAWSVVWGLAAVLLVVLWVSSWLHRYHDDFHSSTGWRLGILNGEGWVAFNLVHDDSESHGTIGGPHWLMVLLAVVTGFAPWFISDRFGLRSLLIATTLIAIVLGLIVWATRA